MEYRLSTGRQTAVKTTLENLLSPQSCRTELAKFWDEQLRIERSGKGLLFALPLLYPDGLQVVLELRPITSSQAILTDRGETIAGLQNAGIDLTLQGNCQALDEKLKIFELQLNGLELQKLIRLPLEGVDVHLFGEALVSISHLSYKHELASPRALHVYNAIRDLLKEQNINFLESEQAYVLGEVEPRIKVDFLIADRHPVACKTIERRGRMRDYIEQWGFRWWDAKRRNQKLSSAMFYDPDNQQWDSDSLKIGENICEVFYPYFETDKIKKALEKQIR